LNKNETPFIDHFNSSENKKKGWEAYEKGQPDLASSFWKTSGKNMLSHILYDYLTNECVL
jgi:hypothetical protein